MASQTPEHGARSRAHSSSQPDRKWPIFQSTCEKNKEDNGSFGLILFGWAYLAVNTWRLCS
jgi:hypothetical protein